MRAVVRAVWEAACRLGAKRCRLGEAEKAVRAEWSPTGSAGEGAGRGVMARATMGASRAVGAERMYCA